MPHSELLDWDPTDRAKLLAHLMETSSRCQQCGTSDWEWDVDPYAYEPIMVRCRGCEVKAAASEEASVSAAPGARVSLVPKAYAAALKAQPKRRPGTRR